MKQRQPEWLMRALVFLTVATVSGALLPGQGIDKEYSEKIREYTTDPRFLSDLVSEIPASEAVPSPLEHFGTIIGAPGVLHYSSEINGYFRLLENASRRVKTRSIGRTEEEREMVEVVISDEETLKDLDVYRSYLNRLADPRGLTEDDRGQAIRIGKPVYYLTAGLHSPETGSPEMIMELAYRLVVDESDFFQEIRKNLIVVIVLAEPDGRDRMVDVYRYRASNNGIYPGLPYWGRYVAHDNNRDGFGLALALTRNILDSFHYWKATVMHDLHESVPFLYISTGTGPYNEYVDPVTIQEWHNMAHEEVTALTSREMPGVWTHGFYTGWAANYLAWAANNRNAIGRFYETFGNSIPDTLERTLSERQTRREWYRSNPPLGEVEWSLRNNINYMESGVLVALSYVARNRSRFLENFHGKSLRAVRKGVEETPHAYVLPPNQKRPLAARELLALLRRQGLEVHALEEDFEPTPAEADQPAAEPAQNQETVEAQAPFPEGSFVVRLDQPYRTLARILLDRQNFPSDATPPYDDTGWTLPLLRNVNVVPVDDPAILEARMRILDQDPEGKGGVRGSGGAAFLVDHTTEDEFAIFRFRLKDLPFLAAEEAFEIDKQSFRPGSWIIRPSQDLPHLKKRLDETAESLGLTVLEVGQAPDVPTHPVDVPRIGLIHTWVATPQDAGWWRHAFDELGIPYTHLSEQDLAGDLSRFDVLILPRTRASSQTLVAGRSDAGPPVPWRQSAEYPNIGRIDETDDVRKGMGYEGLARLKKFLDGGGVFITEGSTSAFPIDMALTRRIRIRETRELLVRGSIVQAEVADDKSPIVYGYDTLLPVYFSQSPVFEVDESLGDSRVPAWLKDETWDKEVPRVVLRFASKDLLMSGMMKGERELAGAPAVLDVPVGNGHVILFANRPFWRWETHGSHALVFNAMLHWRHLRTGWPTRPQKDDGNSSEGEPSLLEH